MEFFDKLGRKASQAYKVTADKTEKIAKETKLKFKIGELKTQINNIYEEIGKKVYEKHIREEDICIKKDLEEQCTKIDVLSDEIDSLLKECLTLKNKKQCHNCYKELEKEDKFCSNCGSKQTDEPYQEAEVLEELRNIEVEPDKTMERQIVMDELEEKIENLEVTEPKKENQEKKDNHKKQKANKEEEKSNLEKTVQIEADVEKEQVDKEAKENLEKTVEIESNVKIEEGDQGNNGPTYCEEDKIEEE